MRDEMVLTAQLKCWNKTPQVHTVNTVARIHGCADACTQSLRLDVPIAGHH